MTDNKWTVKYSVHDGTWASRDNGMPEHFDDKSQALQWITRKRQWLNSIGYMFWHVHLISPAGDKQTIESNPYR